MKPNPKPPETREEAALTFVLDVMKVIFLSSNPEKDENSWEQIVQSILNDASARQLLLDNSEASIKPSITEIKDNSFILTFLDHSQEVSLVK